MTGRVRETELASEVGVQEEVEAMEVSQEEKGRDGGRGRETGC